MRKTAGAAADAPARTEPRTRWGRFALAGRPLEPGELIDGPAIVVTLEPA